MSDEELLRSATVSTDAGSYVEGAVDAITLDPSEEYVVSAYAGDGFQRDRYLASVVMDPRVLFTPPNDTQNAQFIAASTAYPSSFAIEDYRANPDIVLEGDAPAYEYAVFTTNGTWDWAAVGSPATLDRVLVVAAGGGGGPGRAGNFVPCGGGGAGGLVIEDDVTVNADVTVTVGIGGAGGDGALVDDARAAESGGDSSFGSIAAVGGGAGGIGTAGLAAQNGGSGGGTGDTSGPGSGTAGQGHDGGVRAGGGFNAGGGGGARSVGGNSDDDNSGAGGAGRWLEEYGLSGAKTLGAPDALAGGGGGGVYQSGTPGVGGRGGGGAGGAAASNGASAVANSGGGGGGGGTNSSATGSSKGGDGADGIVIVRWIRP